MSIKKFEKDMLKGETLYIQKKQGDLSYPIHRHEYFEIIYYKDCNGKCLLNGKEYDIKDKCIFFLTPEDFHRIDADKNSLSQSVKLSFSKEVIDSTVGEFSVFSAKVLYLPNKICINIIERMQELFLSDNKLDKKECYYLLNALLTEIIKNGKTAGNKTDYMHPLIGKVMMYILTDPSKETTLSDAAKLCHITPAYFSHIFSQSIGKSFKKWVNEIKIEHACRLLESTSLSVLDIALECGFHSHSHFGKVFKEKIGVNPRNYRLKKDIF